MKAKSKFRRWGKGFVCVGAVLALVTVATGVYLQVGHRAKLMPRTEVTPGIFLTVEDLSDVPDSEGRVICVEVHWDTPGVSFELRPLEQAPDGAWNQQTLIPHEWPMIEHGYVAMLNTARMHPSAWHYNYPFKRVTHVEPIIERGRLSHFWEHAYMLWWDKDLNAHFHRQKPITSTVIENAYWGIGIQAGHVTDGKSVYTAMDPNLEQPLSISFIGIDPKRKILWLIAFEHTTEKFMADYAVSKGVIHGGRVDSRNGTHLLLGRETGQYLRGIRNLRFLPGYIGVRYDPPES